MGQSAADSASDEDRDAESGREPRVSVWHALGLTVASAVVWGIAHVVAGRRVAGFLLMTALAALIGGLIVVVLDFRENLKQVAVERDWLAGVTIGILVLALVLGRDRHPVLPGRPSARTRRSAAGARLRHRHGARPRRLHATRLGRARHLHAA